MDVTIRNLKGSSKWDYENGFYWFSDVRRIAKLYSQLTLYKEIVNVPGDIIEFGVYKAASLVRLLSAREMFELPTTRKVIGFDAFGSFPRSGDEPEDEKIFLEEFEGGGGDGLSLDEVNSILDSKGINENVTLIKGDIFETLPAFLDQNTHCRIALLHIDVDLGKPTKFILDQLWPYVSRGGIVLFDDYALVGGATRAIDEFMLNHPEARLQRHSFTNTPTYIVKA